MSELPSNEFSFSDESTPIDPQVDSDEVFNLSNMRGLKIGHLNTNGLLNKIDDIRILLGQSQLDILALCESKLTHEISDIDVSIPNYNLFRLDRDRHGGGVLIYCHTNFSMSVLPKLNSRTYESLWVKIKQKKQKPFYISVTYRSPSVPDPINYTKGLFQYLKSSIRSLPPGSEFFCVGDFNIDMSSANALTSLAKDFSRSCNLTQLIHSPTRITEHSSTIIDLIFSNCSHIAMSGSISCGLSDHNLIYCCKKFQKQRYIPQTISFRNFKNFDKASYISDLQNADWTQFFLAMDVDSATEIFNTNLLAAADKLAPVIQRRVKGKHSPWITEDLIKAIRERDYLLKRASISKDAIDWDAFKRKRNSVTRLKNELKGTYYRNALRENKNKPKELWKKVKEFIPDGSTSSITDLTCEDGTVVSDKKSIANQFNTFFVNIGANLASKFHQQGTSHISIKPVKDSFHFQPFSLKNANKILNSLSTKKSTGLDGVSVRLLKEGSSVLADKLLFIFNLSISSGSIPKLWKVKRVSPIFKSGNKDEAGNYRPVSVASTPMKILEKLVYDQFMAFILHNNILHNNQSGFRSGFSTSSAAIDVKETIIKYLQHHKFVCAVLIDLSKAFDTVDHSILLKKLFCYGFHDLAFDWCQSYLLGSKQQVSFDNILSDLADEKPFGVPHGSVLGPLFFLLYINDINSAVRNSYFHLYADDTIIIQAHNSSDSLISNMETELTGIHDWFHKNKLTPNKKKCEAIFFTNQRNSKKCDDLMIKFNGDDLETKQSVKYLGIHFDNKLSWSKHIKETKRKINHKLAKIRPLARFLDSEDVYMLIRSFIFPYIHYCSPVWSSAATHLMCKLQSSCDKTKLFSRNIPTIDVRKRVNFDIAILTFKSLHNLTPSYLSNMVTLSSQNHHYNTRHAASSNLLHTFTPNKLSTQSIKFVAPHVWNDLPHELKSEQSLLLFKNKCRKLFLN